jgi:hypothetical protein
MDVGSEMKVFLGSAVLLFLREIFGEKHFIFRHIKTLFKEENNIQDYHGTER